jgi:hypothetical protein
VVRTLTAHVAVGQAAELRIDDRRQLTEGELVAVAPGAEELTDVVQSDPLSSVLGRRGWIVSPAHPGIRGAAPICWQMPTARTMRPVGESW